MPMLETEFGKIMIKDFGDEYTRVEFMSDFSDDDTYLCTLGRKQLNDLIQALNRQKDLIDKRIEKINRLMETTNFSKIYNDMDEKYNKYPVMMTYGTAFGYALSDGIIDQDIYDAAYKYYGKLWNYVGD